MRGIRQIEVQVLRAQCPRIASRYRWLRGESGNALVELALIFSLVAMPLLIGTAEMGFLVYDSIEVSNAAHAGSMYGMLSLTYASDTAGMRSAAQAESSDFGTNLTVTPTSYYACSGAVTGTKYTGANAQANAATACTGGSNHPLEFVQVTTSASVTPPVTLPALPASFTITGSSVMEVQQ
jgi:Flp pilus assembly protein TadG